ncbi:hypothetical protein E4U41_005807 [Claviceps citrina]|nr:hypothetical protein E4U41_005807 [Claviceps citrina]
MAAVQLRTRPRVNVNTAAPNSRPKAAAATTPNHDNAGTSQAAAAAAAASSSAAAATPPLSVFLTNLRLLDLDLLPDWPCITMDTFATTGVQGQKTRIQRVEWVLVKLFEIWDPEETYSKLNPLFPPQDQIQSVNLRAALVRALETVKRNGYLGRDSVIRKTMLNDCKGDRLEEVLAYFSTAVLKRVVGEGMHANDAHHGHRPIAVSLALEKRGYDGDDTELHALSLAYRASLRRILAQREKERALYRDFGDLLTVKERGVTRRMETLRAREADRGQDRLSDNAREEMRRLVRNNWSGNEKWMETLLEGDCRGKETGLLGMPFDRVWRRVQQGRLAEIEEDSGGLLEQLESRVRLQKDRLARWNTFRQSAFGQPPETSSSSPSKKRDADKKANRGIDFQFSLHHGLQVGTTSPSLGISQREGKSETSQSYEHLLRGLKAELASIKNVDLAVLDFLGRGRESQRSSFGDSLGSLGGGETVSEMSELEDGPCEAVTAAVPPVRTNRTKLDSLRRHFVKPQVPTTLEAFNLSTSTQSSSSPHGDEELTLRQEDFFIPPPDEAEELEPPPSPGRDMADDILAAMDLASPSPIKRARQRPTLSLAQRTRLSMAGKQFPFLDEEPEPEPPPRPLVSRHEAGPTPPSEPDAAGGDADTMDLVSRTRLSMAGFEQAQKKAQLERRKSLRRGRVPSRKEGGSFPKVDEDDDGLDREALTQELMLEEDAEAVFKSRPKMRTSPVGSPAKEW